jgi:hypothetical protein
VYFFGSFFSYIGGGGGVGNDSMASTFLTSFLGRNNVVSHLHLGQKKVSKTLEFLLLTPARLQELHKYNCFSVDATMIA